MRYGKWFKRIGIVLMVIVLAVVLDRLDRYEQEILQSTVDSQVQPATMSELAKQYVGQSYQF